MDVKRRENDWLVTMSWSERAEIVTSGRHPSDQMVAAIADRASVDVDELRSAVYRFSTENEVEVVVREP